MVDAIYQRSTKCKWGKQEVVCTLSWEEQFWRVGGRGVVGTDWALQQTHRAAATVKVQVQILDVMQHLKNNNNNFRVWINSSSNPWEGAPWVLGGGHWVSFQIPRGQGVSRIYPGIKTLAVIGLAWLPCHLKITWKFKNIAVGTFSNTAQLRTTGEWKWE